MTADTQSGDETGLEFVREFVANVKALSQSAAKNDAVALKQIEEAIRIEFDHPEDSGSINRAARNVANILAALQQRQPAPGAEAVAKAMCCPKGCVRDDDCLAGQRREERERTSAVMALLRSVAPELPSGLQAVPGVTVTDEQVEVASRTYWEHPALYGDERPSWNDLPSLMAEGVEVQNGIRAAIRDALTAALASASTTEDLRK